MTPRRRRIGFDRFIKLNWLEEAARLVDQGLTAPEINAWLENSLESQIQGKDSRRKTRNVVIGVWVNLSDEIVPFRNDGLKLLNKLKGHERLCVHWGLCSAAYPFFAFTVRQIGRLNKLQTEITSGQVRRRVVERYGDTISIHRAVARLIQSLCDWNVLTAKSRGIYAVPRPFTLNDSDLLAWVAEAALYAQSSDSLSLQQIINDPCQFPYASDIKTDDLKTNPRLELFRQGLGEDIVVLATRK